MFAMVGCQPPSCMAAFTYKICVFHIFVFFILVFGIFKKKWILYFCIFEMFAMEGCQPPSCVAAVYPQGETGCGLRGNRHHHQIHRDHHHHAGDDGDDDRVRGETLGEMSCHDGAHT